MSSITTPTIANEPNIAECSNMAKNAPNSIANSLVPSASIGYKRKASIEISDVATKKQHSAEISAALLSGFNAPIAIANTLVSACHEEERQEQLQERLSETYISMVEVLEYTSIGEYDPSEPLNESGFSLLIAGGQETVHFDLDGEDDSYGFGGINQSHSEWEDLYSEYKAVRKEAHQIGVEVEFCGE